MTDALCAEWRKDKENNIKDRKADRLERRFLIIVLAALAGVNIYGVVT